MAMKRAMTGAIAALLLLVGCSSPDPGPAPRRMGSGGSATGTGAGRGESPLDSGLDRVYFDADRAVIRDDARATLDRQAEWMLANRTVTVVIAGNCDERGTTDYNLALGGRRAYAAYTYLLAKGVPANRMTTISFGKDRPSAPGSTEDAWSKNRNAITSERERVGS